MSAARRPARRRLDQLLVERGLAPTREKAQALILAGAVRSAGTVLDKPGRQLDVDHPLELAERPRWVSRGGHKLAGALDELGIDPTGRDAIDVGASTGGFTQVLLERGARHVVALDVGRGQLDWSLRQDERVTVVDGVNARRLDPASLPWAPGLAVIDVSFISLRLVLPPVAACLRDGGEVVALVKPQFEVGRGRVGRGGIVREPSLHREVLADAVELARRCRIGPVGLAASPITGAEGNREFFIHGRSGAPDGEAARFEAWIARLAPEVEG